MTKTVEEVRRAAFEHAYSKLDQQAAQHLLFIRDDGQYGYHTTRTAWGCFNAALDAVEIQLPKTCAYESLDSARVFVQLTYEIGSSAADPVELVRLDDCRAAIEQTGLGLRVK
jgi:hypothetical protein